jgi:hypothetical protein
LSHEGTLAVGVAVGVGVAVDAAVAVAVDGSICVAAVLLVEAMSISVSDRCWLCTTHGHNCFVSVAERVPEMNLKHGI